MPSRIPPPLLLVVLLALLGGASASTATVKTPKLGHEIPLPTLLARAPHAALTASPLTHVFEYTPSGELHGGPDGLSLPLLPPTADTAGEASVRRMPVHTHSRLSASRNGAPPASDVLLHGERVETHTGWTAVFGRRRDVPVAMFGPQGQALAPLNAGRFPGVFVDDAERGATAQPLDGDVVEDSKVSAAPFAAPAARTSVSDAISTRQTDGNCANTTPRQYLEMAVAFDNKLCEIYGNDEQDTMLALQAAIDTASKVFELRTCMKLAIVHFEVNCQNPSDPYLTLFDFSSCTTSRCKTDRVFQGFRSIWRTRRTAVVRDTAYFISGNVDQTSVLGVAYLYGTCHRQIGYGWAERIIPFVIAHEVGHTMSCPHDQDPSGELMRPYYRRGMSMTLSNACRSRVINFINRSWLATCVTGDDPVCDSTCPNACKDGKCVVDGPTTRYCSEGFTASGALGCRWLGGYFFPTRADGLQVRVISVVRYGFIEVSFRAYQRARFSGYSVLVTTDAAADEDDLPEHTATTRRSIRVKYNANELVLPEGQTTCCSKPIYILISVRVCRSGTCVDKFSRAMKTLPCWRLRCRGSTVFVPADSGRRCPGCITPPTPPVNEGVPEQIEHAVASE